MACPYKIRLAAVRVNAELSQEEMANKMQVSRVTIANWESYKTKMSEADLQMFASICGFPRDYIFLPYQFTKCGITIQASNIQGGESNCEEDI